MAHAEVLDKRVSQSEPGWEYLLLVPAILKVAPIHESFALLMRLQVPLLHLSIDSRQLSLCQTIGIAKHPFICYLF